MTLTRAQKTQNTRRQNRMLELVATGASVKEACREIGIHRTTYQRWRSEDPAWSMRMDQIQTAALAVTTNTKVPDFPEFCRRYLKQPIYAHQQRWVDLLGGKQLNNLHSSMVYESGSPNHILINTPPEHAKSTTLSINYPTWRLIADPNVKIMLVSKRAELAEEFLYAIKYRLTHPRYAELQKAFGPPEGFKADAAIWAADRIYLGSQRDSGEKDPTVQAVGLGGQIYGVRSDLIIVDDAVILSNAHEFEKQTRWLQQEVITRLGTFGTLVVVGTRVDAIDLYRHLRTPALYPTGESPWTYLAQPAVLEFAEDPDDWVTLWPKAQEPWPGSKNLQPDDDGLYDKWTGPYLSRRRGMISSRTWALAYQQAEVEEDAVFPAEKVKNCITRRNAGKLRKEECGRNMDGLYVIGSMDPAMVGDTGVLVYAVDRHTKKRWILDGRLRTGATPGWIRGIIKELTTMYEIHEWRIEKNAFQAFLTQDPELQEWLGSQGVRLSEHHTGKNKWDPMFGVASMSILFDLQLIDLPGLNRPEAIKQLVEQLIVWSPESDAKDDLVMALWFAEIRAREVCQASSLDGSGPQGYQRNRWLSRRGRQNQVTVNLNDLAAAKVQHA
jgi:hypothetical protein